MPPDAFPPIETALDQPDGLLAVGGDLSTARLLSAYRRGIFPWFNDGDPILWWSPRQRMVLYPHHLKISRSLRKNLRHRGFQFRLDSAFHAVIQACATPDGEHRQQTWITHPMLEAYCELHRQGVAHSIECWQDGQLVGGLYGVALGKVFFGESMFCRVRDASKASLVMGVVQLQRWGFELIDCQLHTPHLESLGACLIPRALYRHYLDILCIQNNLATEWTFDADILEGCKI
jgi:leucyl/phenylalanyl-tRNA--protein transferase